MVTQNDEAKNLAASIKNAGVLRFAQNDKRLGFVLKSYRPFFTRKVMRSLTRLE